MKITFSNVTSVMAAATSVGTGIAVMRGFEPSTLNIVVTYFLLAVFILIVMWKDHLLEALMEAVNNLLNTIETKHEGKDND